VTLVATSRFGLRLDGTASEVRFSYRLDLERFNLNYSRTPPHCYREVREARRGDPAGLLRRCASAMTGTRLQFCLKGSSAVEGKGVGEERIEYGLRIVVGSEVAAFDD
ncbi:MAG: hypothetical protein ABIV50_13815, partial [Opitutus sp.]